MRRSGAEAGSPSVARAGRGRSLWALSSVVAGFALFGVVVWLAYHDTSRGPPTGEPPLIKALADPIKLPPEEAEAEAEESVAEGGAIGRLWSDAERADQPERLLPPPEVPLSPEVVVEGSAGAEQAQAAPAEADRPAIAAPDEPAVSESAVAALPPATPPTPPAEGQHLSEAEAALDRLLAEVAALSEEQSTAATAGANEPEAITELPAQNPPTENPPTEGLPAESAPAENPSAENPPAENPPTGTVAATTAAPAATAEAPTTEAPAASASETTEIRPASALNPPIAEAAPAEPGATATAAAPAPAEAAQVAAIDDLFRIQLAAVRDEVDAQRAWDQLAADLGPVLSRVRPFFERAETADGIFYRLQIGPFAAQEPAESLCEELKQHNASCFVIRR